MPKATTNETVKVLEALKDEEEEDSRELRVEPCSDGSNQFDVYVHGKCRRVCAKSLYMFPVTGQVRQKVIWLTEHVWFDRFILALIIINSIFLSIYNWREVDAPENKVVEGADPVLLTFFTIESFLKVVSMGFFLDKNSYLRNGWNWLDFVVVVTGIIGELPLDASIDLSFLRVFRVLRPLRSLTVMPEMRVLVNTVLAAIPRLADVLGMALFLFLVFGIMGINFWGGVLFRQCRAIEKPEFFADDGCWSWPVHPDMADRLCGGRYMCEDLDVQVCGSPYVEDSIPEYRPSFDGKDTTDYPWCDDTLKYGKESTYIADFNFRQTHFDHLAAAILVIFQSATLEGWTDIMYMLEDSYSVWFSPLYFCVLIFVTSFFLLNVALAVIWEAYCELSEGGDDEEEDAEDNGEPAIGGWLMEPEAADKEEDDEDDDPMNDDFEEALQEPPWINCPPVRAARFVAFNEVFVSVIMFFITANVVTMMLDKYPPPSAILRLSLEYCNAIFNSVFTLEMAINLLAMGPKKYWTNPVTAFDGVIVVVSLISWMGIGAGGGAARAFRGFRLLRIFRLAKKWTSFRILLKSMAVTAKAMGNFTVLLVLMMYVFTLMAMSFFATSFHFNYEEEGHHMPELAGEGYCGPDKVDGSKDLDCVPRAHFDTFLWAFVTIFQILSGENWNTVMYDGMEAGGFGAVFFFLGILVVGQCIILNLFLALLMAKFEDSSNDIRAAEEEKKANKKSATAITNKTPNSNSDAQDLRAVDAMENEKGAEEQNNKIQDLNQKTHGPRSAADADHEGGGHVPLEAMPSPTKNVVEKDGNKPFKLPNQPDSPRTPCKPSDPSTTPDKQHWQDTPDKDDPGSPVPQRTSKSIWNTDAPTQDDDHDRHNAPKWPWDYSFLVLAPSNPLRKAMTRLRTHKLFDNIILVCICISSLCMAVDHPLADPSAPLSVFLKVLGLIFSTIFAIEMIVKMLSMGFILGRNAYWRSAWNILDGVVVMVSLLDMFEAGSSMKALKTLRILRALRPLRVISRNENLKLVVNTLFKSIPELANLLVVGTLFFLIFALFGVSNFKGTFYSCYANGDDLSYDRNIELIEHPNGAYYTSLGEFGAANLKMEGGRYLSEATVPLCLLADGTTMPMGQFDEDLQRFVVNGTMACAGTVYRRPVPDMPICVAHCNPSSDPDIDRPAGCPAPPKTVENLPSVCPDAGERAPEDVSAEELLGQEYFSKMMIREAMACGGTDAYAGCSEKFCPNVDQEIINSCEDECETHPLYCKDTCDEKGDTYDTELCKVCRAQCRAQCTCAEHCDAYILDAALCVEQGGQWFPTLNQDFDYIGNAMLTLFEISTTEGWVDVMYSACDARGIFMQPIRDAQEVWSLFFVFFILVGSFFILQLCVGVIIDNFSRIKEGGQEIMLTEAQRKWIQAKKEFLKRKIFFGLTDLHEQPVGRRKVYFFVSNSKFDNFIMSCILLNTVVMGMKTFPSPSEEYSTTLIVFNYIFAVIFLCEAILKLYALRGNYFKDAWNKFDFTCVCASLVSIGITLGTDLNIGSVMSAIRLFRIARLFRVVKFARGLNRLFTAFILSIPKLLNVAAILLLLLFLFSVLGVTLFAKVKFQGTHDIHGNFRTFDRAFMTLVRSMTGEAWNEIMHSLSKNEFFFMQIENMPCYDSDLMDVTKDTYGTMKDKCLIEDPQQCGTPMGYVFFVAYTVLCTFVILNLVIAVILEGFEESSNNDEVDLVSSAIDRWGKYDPNFTMLLPIAEVYKFIEEVAGNHLLERPLPVLKPRPGQKQVDLGQIPMRIADCEDTKIDENQNMHFMDVVNLLLKIVLSSNNEKALQEIKETQTSNPKLKSELEALESKQKARQRYNDLLSKNATSLGADVASVKLVGLFRIIKAKRVVRRLQESQRQVRETNNIPKAG